MKFQLFLNVNYWYSLSSQKNKILNKLSNNFFNFICNQKKLYFYIIYLDKTMNYVVYIVHTFVLILLYIFLLFDLVLNIRHFLTKSVFK